MIITLITIVHVFVCFFLMLVVLLQAGKGGGMGIAFGSAGAQQVFGGRGAGGFLEKLTAATAIIFMLTSGALAYDASQTESKGLKQFSEKDRLRKEAEKKAAAEENKKNEEKAKKEQEEKAKKGAEAPKTGEATPPAPAPGTPAAPAPAAPGAPAPAAPAAPAPAPAAPAAPAPAAPAAPSK